MNIDLLRGEARYIGQARGLLFLVDPLRIREVALDRRLKLTEKEVRVPPADYLNDARKLATFFGRTPVKTPLAICLNKLDRWGKLMEPGTILNTLATSVPEEDPDPSTDALVNEEVQSALRKWGATGFLDYINIHFPNHKFFACSALGDAATDTDDAPQPLPTPLLVERPVLWLLERQKVYRRTLILIPQRLLPPDDLDPVASRVVAESGGHRVIVDGRLDLEDQTHSFPARPAWPARSRRRKRHGRHISGSHWRTPTADR